MTTEATESLLGTEPASDAAAAEAAAAATASTKTEPTAEEKAAADAAAAAAKTEPTAEEKAAAEAAAAAAKAKEAPAGAPETYADFTMPEGFAMDKELLGEFAPVLKDLNLTQEAAQKVVDFAPKLVEKTVQQTTAGVLTQLGLADHAKWAGEAKVDKEFGGDKFAENLGIANKALTTFATPEAIALLKQTGLANHPEIIRAFYRAGKQISEDVFVPGGKNTGAANDARKMYANSSMNP